MWGCGGPCRGRGLCERLSHAGAARSAVRRVSCVRCPFTCDTRALQAHGTPAASTRPPQRCHQRAQPYTSLTNFPSQPSQLALLRAFPMGRMQCQTEMCVFILQPLLQSCATPCWAQCRAEGHSTGRGAQHREGGTAQGRGHSPTRSGSGGHTEQRRSCRGAEGTAQTGSTPGARSNFPGCFLTLCHIPRDCSNSHLNA